MIAIVDYKAGNLTSVQRAMLKIGAEVKVTADPDEVRRAERVIFPGVGAAGQAMDQLNTSGLGEALKEAVGSGRPVLGICIGCQIVMDSSEENGATCLGLLPGRVKAFPSPLIDSDGTRLKVPHMGWNGVNLNREHDLFVDVEPGSEFYFVHGYYPRPDRDGDIIGTTDYGFEFPSVIGRENLIALQFHVEKSGRPGLSILNRFATWSPA